jgi:anti-sigma factor RsiW
MDGQRLINNYIDGRMTPGQRQAFERRLTAEPELAREYQALARTLAVLRAIPTDPAPLDLTARIMADVRTRPIPLRRGARAGLQRLLSAPRRTAWALAGAAAVVAVVFLSQGGGRKAEPNVRLSRSDEAFIGDCLVDYHLAASDKYKHGPATPEPGEAAQDAAVED